jgi:hypothetical protein
MPTGLLMGTIALIAVVLGVGIAYRNQAHPPWAFDPLALVHFVFTYLGNALSMGPSQLQALLAPLIGMAMLAIGGLSIRRLWSEERLNNALLWIILFFFAPFNALMTGIGRLSTRPHEATVSRYQSVAAISLIATIALMLAALPRTSISRGVALLRGAAVATLLIAAIVLATNRDFVKQFIDSNETKVLTEIALRQSLESKEHLKGATQGPQELSALAPILRAASHVPFNTNTRCESLLGRRLAEMAGEPAGSMEAISTYAIFPDRGKAVELIGWAERDGASAECIVVIDGRRTAIGAGASMFLRPDTERDKGQPLGRVGWKAVATLPEVMPVCAIALFRGEGEAVPLANCQESIRDEPIGLQGNPGKP